MADNYKFEGEGLPVDVFDEACKQWQTCRTCTVIDAIKDGYQCDQRVEYKVDYSAIAANFIDSWPNWPNSMPKADCSANTNVCDLGRCSCDAALAARLSELMNIKWEAAFSYDNLMNNEFVTNQDGSGFDYKNKCNAGFLKVPSSSGDGGLSLVTERACCGNYPNVVTYNTLRQTCCDEGNPGAFLSGYGTC